MAEEPLAVAAIRSVWRFDEREMTAHCGTAMTSYGGADSELLRRCIDGDRSAWDRFVERFAGLIHIRIRCCLNRFTVPYRREDAEDLFNTVFQVLLEDDCKKLRQFQGRCSLETWLRIITTRIIIDWLRRHHRFLSLDARGDDGDSLYERLPCSNPGPDHDAWEKQARSLLDKVLLRLNDEERLLADLVFRREMSGEQIAAVLQVSREAVFTRKHRLKQKIADMVSGKRVLEDR